MKPLKILLIFFLAGAFLYLACARSPAPSAPKSQAVETSLPDLAQKPLAAFSDEALAAFMVRMGEAYQNRDTAFLRTHLSEDAQIQVDQNGRTVRTDKQQYIALLEKAWSKIKDYQYIQSDPVIAVQDDLANIRLVVEETGTVLGRSVRSRIDASIELKLVEGRIRIQRVTGQSTMSME